MLPRFARCWWALAASAMGKTWSTINLTLPLVIIGKSSAIAALWSRLPTGERPMLNPMIVRLADVKSPEGISYN